MTMNIPRKVHAMATRHLQPIHASARLAVIALTVALPGGLATGCGTTGMTMSLGTSTSVDSGGVTETTNTTRTLENRRLGPPVTTTKREPTPFRPGANLRLLE
jgi:hypothetical protein